LRSPPPANYLEAETIVTAASGTGTTATTFKDGLTLPDGTFLPLNQFHFHSPSEHTFNGMHYPLEMHMVHKLFFNATTGVPVPATATGGQPTGTNMTAAVIGIMFAYECAPARYATAACLRGLLCVCACAALPLAC
jgi:hypothetical protein